MVTILVLLSDVLRLSIVSPMLFELCEATDVILVIIALESDMAINAYEGSRPAASKRMFLSLFLF